MEDDFLSYDEISDGEEEMSPLVKTENDGFAEGEDVDDDKSDGGRTVDTVEVSVEEETMTETTKTNGFDNMRDFEDAMFEAEGDATDGEHLPAMNVKVTPPPRLSKPPKPPAALSPVQSMRPLPSKSLFAPLNAMPMVTLKESDEINSDLDELSGYSRPVRIPVVGKEDVFSPSGYRSVVEKLQNQVISVQQEVIRSRNEYHNDVQRLEHQIEMTEAKLRQSKLIREAPGGIAAVSAPSSKYEDEAEKKISAATGESSHLAHVDHSRNVNQVHRIERLERDILSGSLKPDEVERQFKDIESHEIDNAEAVVALEGRAERDEAHIRQYVEDNSRLKRDERHHEAEIKRLREELDVAAAEKLELKDALLKRDKELSDLKQSTSELSGELLSMEPARKQMARDLEQAHERIRHFEKASKDLEREVMTQKREIEAMRKQLAITESENAKYRNVIDRITDEKKALSESLRRAEMRPKERTDEFERQRRDLESSIQQLREEAADRKKQLTRVRRECDGARKEASDFRSSLQRMKDGATEEIRRLRGLVTKLRVDLRRKDADAAARGRSPMPRVHGSPPPWGCDRGFDDWSAESNAPVRSTPASTRDVYVDAPTAASSAALTRANDDAEENRRQTKRWATTSDLHWTENRDDAHRKAPIKSTIVPALSKPSKPVTHAAPPEKYTATDGVTEKARLAPFATDVSERELQEQVYELEQELMQHNLEKSRIRDKLMQIGARAGRTMAQRRAKLEMEKRLAFLEERASEIRMKLRHFELS